MKKRTISNKGIDQPITDQSGGILANTDVRFLLVTENRLPAFAIDMISRECIASKWITVTTDVNGELEDDFWPTSRSAEPVFYLVQIPAVNLVFMATLEDGDTPITWADFRLSGAQWGSYPPMAVAHIQDNSRHLLPNERLALSAATAMSTDNPIATIQDVTQAGGHTHNNKAVLDDLSDLNGILQYKGSPIGGQGGTSSAVTASGGELVAPSLTDNGDGTASIVWNVIGTSQGAAPDVIRSQTGENLQAFVTDGGEGTYFVEWRVI